MKKPIVRLYSIKSLFDNYKSLVTLTAFLTISLCANAQSYKESPLEGTAGVDTTRKLQPINFDGAYYPHTLRIGGALVPPQDTFKLPVRWAGAFCYKNGVNYQWTGTYWTQFASAATYIPDSIAGIDPVKIDSIRAKLAQISLRQSFVDSIRNGLFSGGGGGDYIPRTGTTTGNPVTGDIEMGYDIAIKSELFEDNKQSKLFFEDGMPILMYTDTTTRPGGGTTENLLKVTQNEIYIQSNNPSFKGIDALEYYGDYYDDNSYVQKKYVDDAIAAGGGGGSSIVWGERFTSSTSSTISLAHTPTGAKAAVYKNGVRLDPSTDYSISTSTVTLSVSRLSADIFLIDYNY